jgi:DNA-binding CsgD family transcriptional regulator
MPDVPPGCPLTERQYQVLQLLSEGHTQKQVASLLDVSVSTIRGINSNAFIALDCTNAIQAVAVMGRHGWFDWQSPEDPTPLAASHPIGAAVNGAFDRWHSSRFADQDARDAMHLVTAGACVLAGIAPPNPRSREGDSEAMRELLHHVAADTLIPTTTTRRRP